MQLTNRPLMDRPLIEYRNWHLPVKSASGAPKQYSYNIQLVMTPVFAHIGHQPRPDQAENSASLGQAFYGSAE